MEVSVPCLGGDLLADRSPKDVKQKEAVIRIMMPGWYVWSKRQDDSREDI